MTYALYVAICLVSAQTYFEFYHGNYDVSLKKGDILFRCLAFWNGLQVILACVNLGILIWSVNRLTKRVNAEHVND